MTEKHEKLENAKKLIILTLLSRYFIGLHKSVAFINIKQSSFSCLTILVLPFHCNRSGWMFLLPEHFHVTQDFLLFGLALIVTGHELLVFFSRPVMTCGCVGCVGPVAITVLTRDRRRQQEPCYPERHPSQYRFLIGLTHSGCFGQHYL